MKIHDDRASLSDLDSMHSSEVRESGIKLQGIAVYPHSDKNAKTTRNQKSDREHLCVILHHSFTPPLGSATNESSLGRAKNPRLREQHPHF